jgi:hypothetical protein
VEPLTPHVLLDLYARLSDEQVDVFLQQLGAQSSAEAIHVIIQHLRPTEHSRFRQLVTSPMFDAALPLITKEALRIVRTCPDLSDDQIAEKIAQQADLLLEATTRVVTEVEGARLKAERDPKPRNTKRDDEIVRLRDEEGRTFGEIPRLLLRMNSSWGGNNGSPLKRDAVEKAYHRRKGQGT